MELFEKVYSCYYNVVRRILLEASRKPITEKQMEEICRAFGYQESALAIIPKLTTDAWPLLKRDGEKTFSSKLSDFIDMPLTALQKSWIRALLTDKRIRLFFTDRELCCVEQALGDIPPMFSEQDFYCFDQYLDGDPYDCPMYQKNFQIILSGLLKNHILIAAYESKPGKITAHKALPYQLQYSAKDDKFRLCCLEQTHGEYKRNTILNVAKIRHCFESSKEGNVDLKPLRFRPIEKSPEPVLLEISGERNSLERCMLHFANYEKHTEYDEKNRRWLSSIYYDLADETELLISILSFGPVVRVLGPEPFLRQIRMRVKRQHQLFYDYEG